MLWFNIEQVYRTLILYIFYKFILYYYQLFMNLFVILNSFLLIFQLDLLYTNGFAIKEEWSLVKNF